jgi:phosphatidylglycerophosphate synthase
MFDRQAQGLITPFLNRCARWLSARGVGADALSLTGFALGMVGAGFITAGLYGWALIPLGASRLCDGLDGAVARQTRPTDRGAFLDIALDFLFYASVPLAFAIANPAQHALPAAVLLAAFIGTGSTFLAFAVLAERRQLSSAAYPRKGLYYLGGLTEAGETLAFFAAMCLWPAAFPVLAYAFAALCALTITTRLLAGWTLLKDPPASP